MRPFPRNLDLFDTLPVASHQPDEAFLAFLASKERAPGAGYHLRASTRRVYSAIWTSFKTWCADNQIELHRVERHHLKAYFDREAKPKVESCLVVQQLLGDIYAHWRKNNQDVFHPLVQQNHGVEQPFKILPEVGNEPTPFLSRAQRALVHHVLIQPMFSHPQVSHNYASWTLVRDKTMVATFLGSGLKVSELAGLAFNCVDSQAGRISVHYLDESTDRLGCDHVATMQPGACLDVLRYWMREGRNAAPYSKSTDLVFSVYDAKNKRVPSNRLPASHPGSAGGVTRPDMMSAPSIHRSVKRVIALAGIEDPDQRISAQTLRNTFAAEIIEQGFSAGIEEHEIASSLCRELGLQRHESALRLMQQHADWEQRMNG
jgi:site-specific recombinase XerD